MKLLLGILLSITFTGQAFAEDINVDFNRLTSLFKQNIGALGKCQIGRAKYTGVDGLELYGFYVTKGRTKVLVSIYGEGKFDFSVDKKNKDIAQYSHEFRESDWDGHFLVKNDVKASYNAKTNKITKLVVSEFVKHSEKSNLISKTTIRCP